jgi:hypothetical protein
MSTDPTPPPIPPDPSGTTPPPPPVDSQFTQAGAPGGVYVEIDRPCVGCSYNLRGLPVTGNCPECGQPVQFSLRGILLQFASPDYLATIRSGVSLVLNGILVYIVLTLVTIFGAVAVSAGLGAPVSSGSSFEIVMSLVQLIPTAMIMLGYWKFTQPDPGFVGIEKPDSARSIVRIAVVIQAEFQVLHVLMTVIGGAMPGAALAVGIFAILFAIVSVVAWAVQFFAMMRYLKWLAARLPDTFIINRAGTYMWLLPVLYTVGSLVCVGPLIALVLYWNLLDRVRKHLRSIVETGQPAILPQTGL